MGFVGREQISGAQNRIVCDTMEKWCRGLWRKGVNKISKSEVVCCGNEHGVRYMGGVI